MDQSLLNAQFYEAVKCFHDRELLPVLHYPIQHPSLLPKLRPYQMRAVKWMLYRETSPELVDCTLTYDKTKAENGGGEFDCFRELEHLPVEKLPTGGVLADEMGLGKTVEVLACILANPRTDVPLSEEDCPANTEHDRLLIPIQSSQKDEERQHQLHQLKIVRDLIRRNIDRDDWSLAARIAEKKNQRKSLKTSKKRNKPTLKQTKPTGGSIQRQAANAWYLSKLSEVNTNPIRAYRESMQIDSRVADIQCVCGELSEDNTISCKRCSRLQHKGCIGASKWYKTKDIYCPQCWLLQEPIKSRATLIVSPNSITGQWLSEVRNHIKKDAEFKVLVYKGVRVDGFSQPYDLSGYDLIITTYEVLRSELNLAEVSAGRNLRYEKRYFTPTCPLLCVQFWRVCLDEAQMVEGMSKAAEMVSRISTIHRWAVTGTPIQKSMNDLYGLVLFLRIKPYWDPNCWKNLIFTPFCEGNLFPLYCLMSHVMWRVSKNDVLDEIQLPPQSECTWWLNFSPIEEHFYLRTHKDCANDFLRKLSKFESLNWTLDSLRTVTVNHILVPLLKLRQACSHPQAVRGNLLSGHKGNMTMSELLESLIKKTKLEGQEALRKHIAALCGMAALHVIHSNHETAAEKYRSVLRISEEYKDRFKVDTLQMLHTLHNLSEILEHHRDIIPPTLRDDHLRTQEVELETSYLNKAQSMVTAAEEALSPLSAAVTQAEERFSSENNEDWWSELSKWLSVTDGDEVLRRVHDVLLDNCKSIPGTACRSIINRVTSHVGIRMELTLWIQSLDSNRHKLLRSLQMLQNADRETLVNQAVDCHLRTSNIKKSQKTSCQLCECDSLLKKYETNIFDIKKKNFENTMIGEVMVLGRTEQGSWKLSEQERVMKVLMTLGKQRKADPQWIRAGGAFLKLLEALRKEFRNLRLLWTRINERTCAKDELNMCKLRLRLRYPDEPAPSKTVNTRKLVSSQLSSCLENKMENIHIIELHEVEPMRASLEMEAAVALSELRKKSGTVVYLQNLRSKGNESDSKANPDPCPVCQSSLGERWVVLSCGHCYCMDCIPQLMGKVLTQCPVCREKTVHTDVSFVCLTEENTCNDPQSSEIQLPSVKGSHSTKVEAIVRRVFYLRAVDPSVKILIFSTWDRVLDVLEEAFEQNGVRRVRLKSGPNYQLALQQFKSMTTDDPVTVLLLPFKLGSKGLNLTEATHVMLVEPVLNPADELQAIGRVHRIGQTRPTVVHRFLVRGTVEERIFSAAKASATNGNKISLRQLRDLFANPVSDNSETVSNLPPQNGLPTPSMSTSTPQADANHSSVGPVCASTSIVHSEHEDNLQSSQERDSSLDGEVDEYVTALDFSMDEDES